MVINGYGSYAGVHAVLFTQELNYVWQWPFWPQCWLTYKVTVTHGNESSFWIRSDCIAVFFAPSIELHWSWSQCVPSWLRSSWEMTLWSRSLWAYHTKISEWCSYTGLTPCGSNILRMFVSEVMEWPHPHTHVAEDRRVTQRVTRWWTTLLLALQSQSNNDNITKLLVTRLTLESTTTNMTPNPHCLSLSGVCGVEGENQSDYGETYENDLSEHELTCCGGEENNY